MILRIWRCPVAADDVEAFDAFMQEHLFPRLAADDGCLSVTTAVDRSGGAGDVPEVVAVSTWRSVEDLRTSLGGDEEAGVFLEEAHRFLAGDPEVVHLEVLAHQQQGA